PPAPPASTWALLPAPSAQPSSQPHADHDPRHGGVVTMVGDHHIEIVVRRDGTILLYPTDAVRRPIAPRDVQGAVRIERPAHKKPVPVTPPQAAPRIPPAPPPLAPTDYTSQLVTRGVPASMTLNVPAGGTVNVGRPPGKK